MARVNANEERGKTKTRTKGRSRDLEEPGRGKGQRSRRGKKKFYHPKKWRREKRELLTEERRQKIDALLTE